MKDDPVTAAGWEPPAFAAARATSMIVGVGASAGGLAAVERLLLHLGGASGVVLVLLEPAAAADSSALHLLLAGATTMPVARAEHGMRVEPDHIYLVAANTLMAVVAGHLTRVVRPDEADAARASVNAALIASNEALQVLNEEHETAKEELETSNEELMTVNARLHDRNDAVVRASDDLVNLLTTVDIPILFLDRDGRIRRFTSKARQLLNVLPADVGRCFSDIRPNIVVPDLDHQIAEVIATMTARESEVQDTDGRWHRLQIRPYMTADARIDGAIVSLLDIDALKRLISQAQQANALAERANRTKDEVLATLSHELRTPLSSMLMRAQLLGRGGMDAAKVQRAGEAIEAGVKLQVQLIDDLLDVSRIVMGKLVLDLQTVDLADVVSRAVEALGPAIARRSLRLGVDLGTGESLAKIHGDAARLQQIVTNLLTNAIKFTPEHGVIKVSLALAGGNAIVRVEDSGMGIDPDFLPHVFSRFTQEDGTSTRAYGGLGLGLAIVRHLVELHHGTVKAASPGCGHGATFSATFPRIRALRAPLPGAAPSPGRSAIDIALLDGLRIVVLDDDLATRDAIADLLGQAGADVRGAQSATSAMAMIDAFRPALLICDIAIPGENGYAFLRRLRARGPAQSGDIPALALTVLAHDDDRERALRAGFQIHLSKPVDIDRLTDAVLELAAGRRPPAPPA